VSVTAAAGFRACGVAAGLKSSGDLDLALVVNDGPSHDAAGVFTRNRVKAAPVLWSQQVVTDARVDAVVLNSGGANACTGPAGFSDTHRTAERVAEALGVSAADVSVCSTGLIGERLPLERLTAALPRRGRSGTAGRPRPRRRPRGGAGGDDDGHRPEGGATDWRRMGRRRFRQGRRHARPRPCHHAGRPHHRRCVPADELDKALRAAASITFDRLDSDGCMSTNDTVLLWPRRFRRSSGPVDLHCRADRRLRRPRPTAAARRRGASKEIAIEVTRAASRRMPSLSPGPSRAATWSSAPPLARTPTGAAFLAAVGTSDARFEPERLAVAVNGVWVCRDGAAGEDRALVDMRGRLVRITVDLGAGDAGATLWTTDLTTGYVAVNSEYPT
jgi:glutamate N-acetyltransferase/amino-acid N-acetyltransferase